MSDLIKHYGGYEKAIIAVKKIDIRTEKYKRLKRALLEYRRQNNLITLGDWIFIQEYKPELQMHQITKDDIGSHWIKLVKFRHATDEEIEQIDKGGDLNDSTSSDHT